MESVGLPPLSCLSPSSHFVFRLPLQRAAGLFQWQLRGFQGFNRKWWLSLKSFWIFGTKTRGVGERKSWFCWEKKWSVWVQPTLSVCSPDTFHPTASSRGSLSHTHLFSAFPRDHMYHVVYFKPPSGQLHFLQMLQFVDEVWMESDSWFLLFIRLKQSASQWELCLPSAVTSTHTVIITMETCAADRQRATEVASENDNKQEIRIFPKLLYATVWWVRLEERVGGGEYVLGWVCVCSVCSWTAGRSFTEKGEAGLSHRAPPPPAGQTQNAPPWGRCVGMCVCPSVCVCMHVGVCVCMCIHISVCECVWLCFNHVTSLLNRSLSPRTDLFQQSRSSIKSPQSWSLFKTTAASFSAPDLFSLL